MRSRIAAIGATLVPWTPATVAALACILALRAFGTPIPISLVYLVYLILGVALPGTLAWRVMCSTRIGMIEDVAVGSAIGLGVQALLGFGLAAIGWSGWAWVWGLPVVIAALVVPQLRSRVWSTVGQRTSPFSAWTQAAAVVGASVWLGVTSIAASGVSYLDRAGISARALPTQVYVDMPYHHALAAGIDSNFPLVFPYLWDEPLRYHIFVYEHLAAGANATGVDLTWIVYRLWVLPLVALGVVLAGVLAHRLSGRPAAAPIAAVFVALSASVSVYGWTSTPFRDPGYLNFATFRSPTHTFGVALLLAAATVATVIMRSGLRGNGPTVAVFAVLAVAAGGAKATTLPVLACGLIAASVAAAAFRGRWRAGIGLTGVTLAAFAAIMAMLLRGKSGSLWLAQDATLASFQITEEYATHTFDVHGWLILAMALTSWLAVGAGAILLVRQYRDPMLWALVGVVVAGTGAALLTQAHGMSQMYFLLVAWPLLGVLSAWGVTDALERLGGGRTVLLLTSAGVVVGIVVVRVVASTAGAHPPLALPPPAMPRAALLLPWLLLLLAAAALGTLAWGALRRRSGSGARLAGLLMAALVLIGSGVSLRTGEILNSAQAMAAGEPVPTEGVPVPREGGAAAVWVRDHAATGDVVATNAHCYGPPDACDSRHFWVSALTERRVLVEGWAYPGDRPGQTRSSPYWDAERYERNEAVFNDPSQEAVDLLADEYGVRWLLVDRTVSEESADLRRYATLVHESAGAAVYEITG